GGAGAKAGQRPVGRIARGCIAVAPSAPRLRETADQLKRRPEKGMGVAAPEFQLGTAQRLRGAGAAAPILVKALHELGGGAVVHIPQAGDDRARPGIEK